MEHNTPYRQLPDGRVLLDYGPMTLSVCAKKDGEPHVKAAIMGIEKGLASFERLLNFLDEAKSFIPALQDLALEDVPDVLQKMVTSVRLLDDPTFTPMAAVAGSFADVIREEIVCSSDADYVIVNNGGDISYFTGSAAREFQVGIISDITLRQVTHRLQIPPDWGIHGIATSGFGGRSLSRGIASAVTVIAKTCSLADAAATDIANHTITKHPAVQFCLAEEIDYDTDIPGLTVVREVGRLNEAAVLAALRNGIDRAKLLYESGMIQGAVLFLQDKYTCYPDNLTITPVGRPAE